LGNCGSGGCLVGKEFEPEMASHIQIFTDDKGNKTSVIVPYKDWAKLNGRLAALQNKLNVFSSIRDGMREVKKARESGKKLQLLSDFVNESRG
jgi:hypothetical protein